MGTGQTRLRNSQAATHWGCLARCSPHALGFSREQSTWYLTMGGSPFCSHGGFMAVRYLSWLPTHMPPFSQWTHLQQISTQASAKNHYPSSTVCQYTPAAPFPQPQFPSFCKRQLALLKHNLVISSLIVSALFVKQKLIGLLQGIKLGLMQREFNVITTMLPITAEFKILQFVHSHYQIQDCNYIHPLDGDRADTFNK